MLACLHHYTRVAVSQGSFESKIVRANEIEKEPSEYYGLRKFRYISHPSQLHCSLLLGHARAFAAMGGKVERVINCRWAERNC
jgi:hypothetical protein